MAANDNGVIPLNEAERALLAGWMQQVQAGEHARKCIQLLVAGITARLGRGGMFSISDDMSKLVPIGGQKEQDHAPRS